jgi:hypothetical protein
VRTERDTGEQAQGRECCDYHVPPPFSVAAQFTASTGKKVDSREECYWSHTCSLQASRCVGSNNILERKILFKSVHRACTGPDRMLVARGCWLLEREEHRACTGPDWRVPSVLCVTSSVQ